MKKSRSIDPDSFVFVELTTGLSAFLLFRLRLGWLIHRLRFWLIFGDEATVPDDSCMVVVVALHQNRLLLAHLDDLAAVVLFRLSGSICVSFRDCSLLSVIVERLAAAAQGSSSN